MKPLHLVAFALAVGLVFFIWSFLVLNEFRDDYKRGQIDALNGHVHYQLTTQPSGETKWEAKK